MAFDYINEAFKRLDIIEEAMFNTTSDGIENLSKFMSDDDSFEETVRVIDSQAETEEDLEDSYIGKVIINCNVCHSHVFSDKDEIDIDSDGTVNPDMKCPYCGEEEGFVIVGEIAPYDNKSDEVTVDVEPVDNEDSQQSDTIEEQLNTTGSSNPAMSRATARVIEEDFKEVSITTDDQHMEMTSDENGKITVVSEPVTMDPVDEIITPLSDESKEEIIINNTEEAAEEITAEDNNIEPTSEDSAEPAETTPDSDDTDSEESVDISLDEVDEDSIDELGESYFRNVYGNIESFKTTNVSANNTHLIVEGLITFTSGNTKKTGFMFEAQDINSRGQLRFKGFNKQLSESKDAFSLVGTLDNKKLFLESLKYNYSVGSKHVRGLVRRK